MIVLREFLEEISALGTHRGRKRLKGVEGGQAT